MKKLILLETKRKFFTNRVGAHTTAFSGSGVEFKDIIHYDSSQSVRNINWKKSTKEAVVSNSYYDERELSIAIVYLNSGSMRFANKAEKAIEAVTALSSVAIESRESLTTLFFNSKQSAFYPPTKKRTAVDINYSHASSSICQGEIDIKLLTQEILYRIRKRSILFIIGDFLELIDLSKLSHIYETYAVVIRAKEEEDLTTSKAVEGDLNIVDLNSDKQEFLTLNRKSKKVYNNLLKEHDKRLIEGFRKSQVIYTKIYTEENTIDKLVELTR
ncbi:MAG TPA: DUF58 domain-containing protein [Nitratifractor sp.]|jgi:uncharacterized protein (DUF58 family)|nr:DUF58 domain-containing protein [Nitratifractor sp.]HHD75118.1 DUF58 domain-containing protein [Nitratifractor sp.]